jgi:GT2 family glycosyltransferase
MSLKDKWLEFYETNHSWIKILMEESNFSESLDKDETRPEAWFILGVVSALEPSLKEMLVPFCKLNTDEDALVDALGLNFDPEKELTKWKAEKEKSQPETEYLKQFRT